MAGVANRQGMVFVDDDDEDDSAPVMTSYEHGLQRPGSPVSSSGVESEGSYAEVYSDDSYHSDGDEIAEMWDPYCTCIISLKLVLCGLASHFFAVNFLVKPCTSYVRKGGCIQETCIVIL